MGNERMSVSWADWRASIALGSRKLSRISSELEMEARGFTTLQANVPCTSCVNSGSSAVHQYSTLRMQMADPSAGRCET